MLFTNPNHLLTRSVRPRATTNVTVDRLREWIDWYRFARETFDYGHAEAVTYANARYVEELNRQQLGRNAA
jgi:hypothetical protein